MSFEQVRILLHDNFECRYLPKSQCGNVKYEPKKSNVLSHFSNPTPASVQDHICYWRVKKKKGIPSCAFKQGKKTLTTTKEYWNKLVDKFVQSNLPLPKAWLETITIQDLIGGKNIRSVSREQLYGRVSDISDISHISHFSNYSHRCKNIQISVIDQVINQMITDIMLLKGETDKKIEKYIQLQIINAMKNLTDSEVCEAIHIMKDYIETGKLNPKFSEKIKTWLIQQLVFI